MGRRRIEILRWHTDLTMMGFDADSGATAYASGAYDIGYARQISDIWDWKPDAVLICTPPDSHLQYLHEAREAGVRAVFCEKPLATLRPFMPWLDKFKDLVTMVGCNWRFHPGPKAVKAWLDEGVIGDVTSARFQASYPLPPGYLSSYVATTGVTLDVGSHLVDLAIDWLGPAKLVAFQICSAAPIGLPRIDGQAMIGLMHDSGAASMAQVSFLVDHAYHAAAVVGQKGMAFYGRNERRAWHIGPKGAPQYVGWGADADDAMYIDETDHFLACVREGRQTCNPISKAAETLSLLLEAKQKCPIG